MYFNKKVSQKISKKKSFLTDNFLTKYMEKLYDNKPTYDTSKVSGKELRQKDLTEEDISYLKSITDGAKSFGAPSNLQTQQWSWKKMKSILNRRKI